MTPEWFFIIMVFFTAIGSLSRFGSFLIELGMGKRK